MADQVKENNCCSISEKNEFQNKAYRELLLLLINVMVTMQCTNVPSTTIHMQRNFTIELYIMDYHWIS